MTDIEIIAKLLGWKKVDHPCGPLNDADFYQSPSGGCVWIRGGRVILGPSHHWPDPDDYNTIRQIEDALAAKGLDYWLAYKHHLLKIHKADEPQGEFHNMMTLEDRALRATAAQRIAAAAAVLREVG